MFWIYLLFLVAYLWIYNMIYTTQTCGTTTHGLCKCTVSLWSKKVLFKKMYGALKSPCHPLFYLCIHKTVWDGHSNILKSPHYNFWQIQKSFWPVCNFTSSLLSPSCHHYWNWWSVRGTWWNRIWIPPQDIDYIRTVSLEVQLSMLIHTASVKCECTILFLETIRWHFLDSYKIIHSRYFVVKRKSCNSSKSQPNSGQFSLLIPSIFIIISSYSLYCCNRLYYKTWCIRTKSNQSGYW